MSEAVSIVLVGLGGYGEVYLGGLLDEQGRPTQRLVGAVDPEPERCGRLEELRARRVPVYATLEEFYRQQRADLAVISSPIHQHGPQTCLALHHGSYVLCEKPAAATVQEVAEMAAAADRSGRWVAIGYQWSYSRAIQELKRDVIAGVFGRARRWRTLCLWPRDEAYYGRNDWAGRKSDGRGHWVLDSPVNNAMAHDLHNALYVLGSRVEASARPVRVTAELYRANDIENCDTAAVRVETAEGAEILFYGSHAVADVQDPIFCGEFERAYVTFEGGSSPIVAELEDGTRREYGSPDDTPQTQKLWDCVAAVAGGAAPCCQLAAAGAQTLSVNGAQDSAGEPAVFPAAMVRERVPGAARLVWVEGLAEALRKCYDEAALPAELGLSWARGGTAVDLNGYVCYPGGVSGRA
ncbi:MAG: Gfo/Idh/MocA family oxidoreductase [Phycisphaerae bacterium]|jgi:predicted dehydrogenase